MAWLGYSTLTAALSGLGVAGDLPGVRARRARIPALARAPPSEEQEAADLIIICLRLPGDAMATKSGIQAEPDLVRPGGHKVGAPLGEGG